MFDGTRKAVRSVHRRAMLRMELALIMRILLLFVYFGSIDSGVLGKDGAVSTSLWKSKSTNLTPSCCQFTPYLMDIYSTDNSISFTCSKPPKELQDCFHYFKLARLLPTSLERIYEDSIDCTADSYVFENLKSDTYHRFRVAACSDYNEECCTWSSIQSVPTQEKGIIVEATTLQSISIRLSLLRHNSSVYRVKASCKGKGVGPFEVDRTTSSYVFEGLEAECSYIVVLQTRVNSHWYDSHETRVRTMDRDPRFIPTVFATESTSTTISIEWLMPPPEVRNRIRQYKLMATADGEIQEPTYLPATTRFHQFQDLRVFETYAIKVAACSEFKTQCGDWSEELKVSAEFGGIGNIYRGTEELIIVSVIGTTDRSITIGWYEEKKDYITSKKRYKVMVTLWDQISETISLPDNVTSYVFDNLTSNTSYCFRVAVCRIIIREHHERCSMWSLEKEALTKDRDPIFIPSVWIDATTSTSIKVGWSMPPEDLQHRVHQYKVEARGRNRTHGPVYLNRTLNSYVFKNLIRETKYRVKVAACSDYRTQCGNWSSEMEIRTMDRDPKFVPLIRLEGRTRDSITVGWSTPPPKLKDDIQQYKVMAIHPRDERRPFYVNQTINSYVFQNLTSETSYRFKVAACSDCRTICGNWSSELEVFTIDEERKTRNDVLVGLTVAIVLLVVLVAVIIWMIIRRYRRKVAKKKFMDETLKLFNMEGPDCLDPELNMAERAELLPYNKKWEYPRELLQLGKILGSGAFGIVRKGLAKSIIRNQNITTVAVKMVLATNRLSYMTALTRELKILAYLGKHVNVVNLLGACTGRVSYGELLVIVEYCRYGNIRDYLIRSRADFLDQVEEIIESIPDSSPATENVDLNESHENTLISDDCRVTGDRCDSGDAADPSPKVDDYIPSEESAPRDLRSRYDGDYADLSLAPIGTRDLLCWAWQVSRGMRYLGERRILHGDLAARNILRADNNVVKICDFGMATALYKEENFKKKGHGPLPVKWMAIESLKDRIFSVKSDVWSYGVVLWEIFSLGETPYPEILQEEVRQVLTEGYRMPRPKYAPQDMYQIMRSCWDERPSKRPSFQKLEDSIAPLLEESVKMLYVDMGGEYIDLDDDIFASGGGDEPVVDQFRTEDEAGDAIVESAP